MILSKKATAVVGGVAALALGLSACSGSGGSGGGTGSAAQKAKQAGANSNDINAMDYSKVPSGGTLHWPIDQFPTNFNPAEVDGNEVSTAYIINAMLPTVWHFNAQGTPQMNTAFVDKAEETSTSPQTIEYHIKSGVTWNGGSLNGQAVDYQDFVGTWKSQDGADKAYQIVGSTGYDQIQSVTKGDTDQDVKVVFKTPFPDWKSLFGAVLPRTLTDTAAHFNKSWADGPDTSAGPFMISKIDKTGKTITSVPNPKWTGNKPKLDSIVYLVTQEDALAKALQSGQIDFADTGASASVYQTVKNLPNIQVRKAGGPNWRHIDLSSRGALKDLKVRQAIMLSLDRAGDAKALLSSLDWPATVLNSHIWMNNQAQYKETCGDYCNQNITKADSLLQGEGYAKGSDGIYAKGGSKLTLQFVIPSGVPTSASEAQIQQNALKKAGIAVSIKTVNGDNFFSDYVLKGQFDLTIFSWIGTPFPVSSAKSIYIQGGGQNWGQIGNATIDNLFKQATTTPDSDQATNLSYQIDQQIWNEGFSAPLYQRPDVIACKKNLVNYGALGFSDVVYENIGFSK